MRPHPRDNHRSGNRRNYLSLRVGRQLTQIHVPNPGPLHVAPLFKQPVSQRGVLLALRKGLGNKLQQAGYAGIADGFGIMADYVKATLNDIKPSVSVVNGQRVSVVLLEPVVLNVPESEFAALQGGATGSFSP